MSDEARDYAEIALRYAVDVIDGRVPACKWTFAACLRQLADLARAETPEFPYRYEPEAGARVCHLIELLPHIKGKWKSRTITLEPWQIFIQMTLFSWVCASGEREGMRRFRTDYEEVPRKNAKSTISAGRALYMVAADDEQGAECYSAATTRDQAKIVFDVSRAMAKKTPMFLDAFGVSVLAHQLLVEDTESFLKALSADYDGLDGLNPHFASVDELHAHKDRGVWDVLETATGARAQSLLSSITTAGSNRAGICYEVRGYLVQILNGVLRRHPAQCEARGYKAEGDATDDESFFGIIYTVDDPERWTEESEWRKANPNLGISVKLDDLQRKCAKAQRTLSAKPNFLTKHLNVWIHSDTPWMDMVKWDACADPTLAREQFAGAECIDALDLATKIDIVGKVSLFRREIDGKFHYYGFATHYIPEETLEDSDNSQYAGWEDAGHLTTTDGNVIDFEVIKDELKEDAKQFNLRQVAHDPWQAAQLANDMSTEGLTMVEVRQIVAQMSEPMKELEALVREKRFHHTGDPVLAWMASNVVAHRDAKDNMYPKKEKPENKIDGVVALIMALSRFLTLPVETKSIYETQGIDFL